MLKILNILIVISFLALPLAKAEIQPMPVQLSDDERELLAWIQSQQKTMLKDLKTYVNINTGTFNHAGINSFRNLLQKEFQSIGFETSLWEGGEIEMLTCHEEKMVFADHLFAKRSGEKSTKVLLNGHLDTVFAKKDEFQNMIIETDGTLKGQVF